MNLIRTDYGFRTTANDVIKGIRLDGKNAIVTGGASGIGLETVRALSGAGAKVTIATRNLEVATKVAKGVNNEAKHNNVTAAQLDLADIVSIKQFAESWQQPLHLLINNAGVMALPDLRLTSLGMEMQFMVNYFGHFVLANSLYPALQKAGTSRIVVVSSSGHLFSPVIFDDINFLFREYDPLLAYGQSKTACNLFTVASSERWSRDGIYANALNPGAILTNLQRHVGGKLKSEPEFHKTVQQGAATSVFLATSPLVENIGGKYFEDCNEALIVTEKPANYSGAAAYSLDRAYANRLWDCSANLLPR